MCKRRLYERQQVIVMFEVDSCVMYGKIGVCKITGIRNGRILGKPETEYYVLHPVFSNDLEIMTPIDGQRTYMRELVSEQKVYSLIESIPEQEPVWEDDSKIRNARFMTAMNTGRCEEWIAVIKSIDQKSEEFRLNRKKLSYLDETMLKDAKRLLYEEFSHSLHLRPEDIESFILKRLTRRVQAS